MLFDAQNLPFRDENLECVTAIEVLEHVENPRIALEEIARATSRWAVISVPNGFVWRLANLARGKYFSALGNTPEHINEWSKRTFTQFISDYFVLEYVETPFPWIVALMRKKR